MDELTIGNKTYVSSKRAAEITGYAKDYVGQLCREGHVEARMVGRSWYVLETSIREHRFGPAPSPALEDAREAQKSEPRGLPSTWEAPTYAAETATPIPDLPKKQAVRAPQEPAADDSTIADMQAAWKEWFENRQEPRLEAPGADEPRLESPEVMEAREEEAHERGFAYTNQENGQEQEGEDEAEEPVAIPFERIPEPSLAPEREEPVPIRKVAPPPAPMPQGRPVAPQRPAHATSRIKEKRQGGTSLVGKAALVAAAGLVIVVGIIGSGFASSYMESNPIVQYLGGTSTIQK